MSAGLRIRFSSPLRLGAEPDPPTGKIAEDA